MNLANKITMIRIILIPVIITLVLLRTQMYGDTPVWNDTIQIGQYNMEIPLMIAGILFIIASVTDWLDGFVARKYNMVTTFGKFFDSIADKLLTNSVIILFSFIDILPIWMALIIVCRDFLIDVVRQVLASANYVMAANNWGRYKAACEMVGLSILFFINFIGFNGSINDKAWIEHILIAPMYIATTLSIISAGIYIYQNRKNLFDMTTTKENKSEKE